MWQVHLKSRVELANGADWNGTLTLTGHPTGAAQKENPSLVSKQVNGTVIPGSGAPEPDGRRRTVRFGPFKPIRACAFCSDRIVLVKPIGTLTGNVCGGATDALILLTLCFSFCLKFTSQTRLKIFLR